MLKKIIKSFSLGIAALMVITPLAVTSTLTTTKDPATTLVSSNHNLNVSTLADLNKANPSDVANMSKYDSRDYSIVTPVKSQGDNAICWSYAITSALETSILKQNLISSATADNLDINEFNVSYATNVRNNNTDPLHLTDQDYVNNHTNSGGWTTDATNALMQWNAPVYESSNWTTIHNPIALLKNTAYLGHYYGNTISDLTSAQRKIKEAIVKYGSVVFDIKYNGDVREVYHNNNNSSSYGPHSCVIVGWDDTISKDLYSPASKYNGGWIVKNSWSTGFHKEGYFYLSYDSDITNLIGLEATKTGTYQNNYYYDGLNKDYQAFNSLIYSGKKLGVIFPAKKGSGNNTEKVKAVNLGIRGDNVTAEIKVYKDVTADLTDPKASQNNPSNGKLVAKLTKAFDTAGFHTVDLPTPIQLDNNSNFSIVVSVSNTNGDAALMLSKESSTNDMTYYLESGKWNSTQSNLVGDYDIGNIVPRIKAFTTVDSSVIKNEILTDDDNGVTPTPPTPETPTAPDITTDVTITNKPDASQTISADVANGLDLTVSAQSKEGKELTYQWYVSKSTNGTDSWQKITGATSSTYNIPSSELKAVTTETTWKYKLEISYKDFPNSKLTSGEYSVTIKPVSTPTPTPPVNPNPDPTPNPNPDVSGDINKDITINKQPNTNQDVPADRKGGLDLTINASSTQGKTLTYQWYQDKNDGNGWTKIAGATKSTYNIPASELQACKTNSTWKYKAEIEYQDGSNTSKYTSETYSVNVKPVSTQNSTGGGLSTPAIAGIAAGAVVSSAALLGSGIWFFKKKKK